MSPRNTDGPAADTESPAPMTAGVALGTAAQLVTAVAGGLTGVVLARTLGPAGTGAFNVAVAALTILMTLATLGVGTGLTYHVSGGRWPAPDALRQALVAALALGVAGAVTGIAVALFVVPSAFDGVPAAATIAALGVLPAALAWTLHSLVSLAERHYITYALPPAAQSLAALVLVAALAPAWGVTGAVAAVAAAHVATAAVLAALLLRRRRATGAWLRESWSRLTAAGRFGIRPEIANGLELVSQRVDLLILNAYAATASVGHYAIALSITSIGALAPRALAAALFPRVSELAGADRRLDERSLVVRSGRHVTAMAAATAVALALGLLLVPLVYGPEFRPAIVLGLILVPGVAALSVGGVLWAAVVGRGYPQYPFYAALVVTPLTVVLYLVAIPWLGATGAALASTVSYAGNLAVRMFFFTRVTGIRARELAPGSDVLADYRHLAARIAHRLRGRAGAP